MKQLEKFTGTVSQGYVGNIQYHMELTRPYQKLQILLTYDKEKCHEPSQKLLAEMKQAYAEYTPTMDFESQLPNLLSQMNAELHLAAFLNDEFIGNVHMPGNKKEMIFSLSEATPGCMLPTSLEGHLKIIVNCFQILCDDTNYILTISGE